MDRVWVAIGALAGLGAVAMAAAAAHALTALSPQQLRAVDAAVQMQGWHALALVACGLLAMQRPGRVVHAAGAAFALGMLLFCGAVYASALAGIATGPMAPIGGTLLMLGWVLLGAAALLR